MIIIQKYPEFCRDEPDLAANRDINDFNAANATTNLLKIKEKITGQRGNDDTKNVEIMVPFERCLISCEFNRYLNSAKKCEATFSITDTKLYVPVVIYQIKIMQNCFVN